MSLEQSIQNLADAINNLAASNSPTVSTAIRKIASASAGEIIAATDKQTDAKTAVADAKAKAEAAKIAKEMAEKEKAAEAELVGAPDLDYDKDVAPALTGYLSKHGRAAGVELLKKYGAKSGKEIKAADYQALLADIESAS